MEIKAGTSGDEAEQDEDERFYAEHRDELLAALRGGHGFSGGEMFNRLEQRGDGGVGIANQGATCYMNTLLQVLFHTPEFRSTIYGFRHDAAKHGEEARCIPLQLQRLFARMQLSRARAVSTVDLTDACGMSGHTGEQHDVQELCRVLFDALGRSSVMLRKEIERLYEGQSVQYVRTREPHDGRTCESSRKESVLDLQVPIVGCRTLEEALRKLVEPEELTGDNQWQCDELGTKVDALKGLEFESLPQILHLQLMRFIFDFQSMRRKKLTDNLSIPLELDARCLLGPSAEPTMYQLSGMCVQFGSAGGGHYVAKVRDASTGHWLDANDRHVGVLTPEQVAGLFRPRSHVAGEAAAPETDGGPQVVALDSTDAYYLVYRRMALETQLSHDVPSALVAEIAEENARLEILQRAYLLHKELWEVRVFAPLAAELALRKHVTGRLDGLLADSQPCEAGESQSVVVSIPGTRRVVNVLRRALAALAERGASDADLAWAVDLGAPGGPAARLRKYDAGRGSVQDPLDNALQLKECCKDSMSSARAALILEVAGPDEAFEAWEEGSQSFVVCRWRPQLGGASVSPGDLRVLRLKPERPIVAEGAKGAQSAALAAPSAAEQDEVPVFDPCSDELPDLFGDCGDAAPAQQVEEAAISVGDLRVGAAAAWGLAGAIVVPLTGAAAGKALTEDGLALSELGVSTGDVICVEEEVAGQEPQSAALYDRVKNSAILSFNHPDRPSFSQEYKLSVAKTATLGELKAHIAAGVLVDPAALHLGREQTGPQMKDESRTIAELGLSDHGSVFVGHGAPCPVDRTLLAVHVYPATGGGAAARGKAADFHHAARGPDSVASFRQEVAAPLLEWARGVANDSDSGETPEPRVPLEGISWRRLRIRDVKAGGIDAILRDWKALNTSLPGLVDGRQVGVEVLGHDEELQPDEVVVLLRAWLVSTGCLLPPSEVVITRLQSLGEFRRLLESRFAELVGGAVQGTAEARTERPPEGEMAPDRLEVAVLPRQPGTMGPKQCAVLKWPDERLNPIAEEALARPLADLKEIRDGVVLVLRSHLDASRAAAAAPQPPDNGGKTGKGRGKGPSAPPAKAKGFSSIEEGAAAVSAKAARAPPKARSQERGVHIEVACPMLEEDTEHGSGASGAAT